MYAWINTLTVRFPKSKDVNRQSIMTLRQAPGHKELYKNGQQLEWMSQNQALWHHANHLFMLFCVEKEKDVHLEQNLISRHFH